MVIHLHVHRFRAGLLQLLSSCCIRVFAACENEAREKQTYELDGLGLDIFRMIDDQKTVGDLVDFLIDLEKLTFFESWGLIQHYLGDLAKRGIIAIVVPER